MSIITIIGKLHKSIVVVQSVHMSSSLWPHGLQHSRLPCPSLSFVVCSNSCPLSQFCHSIISSSVAPSPSTLHLSPHQSIFQWVGPLHQWLNYRSFSFSISPSNEYSGLISFRIDWFDLFPRDLISVQGTLKNLQHHNSKASILQCSAFFMVQFSHPYMTTGKLIALTIWIFVGKVMSLLFNMLSRFIIAFLAKSKCLLISCLKSPSAVILEPRKIKPVTVSIFSPSIGHDMMGLDAMIFIFWMLSFKPAFSLSSFTFIKWLFSSSLLSALRMVLSVYLRLLIFLPAILIPACASSSPAFTLCTLHIS